MKNKVFFMRLLLCMAVTIFYRHLCAEPFSLIVKDPKDARVLRVASFVPADAAVKRFAIRSTDPGAQGHLTVLVKDKLSIKGENETVERSLHTPYSYVFTFEAPDALDSVPFVPLVADSIGAEHFFERMTHILKREWEIYRLCVRDRSTGKTVCVYLRFQHDIFTLNLPDKNNRETIKLTSISPSIPVIHVGNIDYSRYTVGPGISFNVGLKPRKPLWRLVTDLLGPVSVEWMFKPINSIGSIDDALAIRSAAVGLFFNSGYGIFHWGIAWYTLTYCRAEAYFGINFAPAMQLFNGRKSWRYRW